LWIGSTCFGLNEIIFHTRHVEFVIFFLRDLLPRYEDRLDTSFFSGSFEPIEWMLIDYGAIEKLFSQSSSYISHEIIFIHLAPPPELPPMFSPDRFLQWRDMGLQEHLVFVQVARLITGRPTYQSLPAPASHPTVFKRSVAGAGLIEMFIPLPSTNV
jgi:hypothetical protein